MSDYVCRRCHKAKRIFEFPEDSTDFTVCVECMRESYLEERRPRYSETPIAYPPIRQARSDARTTFMRPEPELVAQLRPLSFVDPFLKNGKYEISGDIRCSRAEGRQVTRSLNEAIRWFGIIDPSSEFAWWRKPDGPDGWVYFIQRIRRPQR